MKRTIIIAGVLAFLSPAAYAQGLIDKTVADLQAQGYDFIEVKDGPTQVKIEAISGTREFEIVFDKSTGEVLKRETGISDLRDRGRIGVDVSTRSEDFVGENDDDDDDRDDDDDDRDDDDDDDRDDDDDDDDRDDDDD